MPTSRNDVRVQCPFYRYDEKQDEAWRIVCEGVGGATTIALVFRSGMPFRAWIDAHCCGEYVHCAVCRMIAEKYEEDGE